MTSKTTDRRTFLRNVLTGATVAGAATAVAASAVAAPRQMGGSVDSDVLTDTDASIIDQNALSAMDTPREDWMLTDDSWYPAFRQGQKLLLDEEGAIVESGFYLIEKNGVPMLAKASVGANTMGLYDVDLSWDLWDHYKESFGIGVAPTGARVRAVVYPI